MPCGVGPKTAAQRVLAGLRKDLGKCCTGALFENPTKPNVDAVAAEAMTSNQNAQAPGAQPHSTSPQPESKSLAPHLHLSWCV